ncbi:uncharacterized protein F4807DRAFT_450236 [Annulohypoxylon truncatum]|uniref:uncharacterized protein n=1 Tax=Annulohypoxylon truncatum TaxID=327061 RepID=UPI0020087C40|nr:uncharacterized protein F4807DRAFT_450236 [Annulohypoxylon truncatum]KAI1212568.1 hypothetical protein F4807DRAFT_450236 [Annulohypoxylon truncatum]
MANILPYFVAISVYLNAVASFNLYPALDSGKLATAFNVTEDCILALNQSIPECDQTLFQMVSSFENYWWEDDNVTALCGTNCSDAAQDWDLNVASACDDQYYSAYGKLVPAWTISERFVDGIGIACLSSMTEADTWCLPLSQNFTGSDIIRADCDTNPSDPSCSGNASSIPSDDVRMANLYDDDVLCNDCFVQMLYRRVTSSYLEDSDYSDYLVGQLQDIADVCSTLIPNIAVRQLPTYEVAPPVTSINFGANTTTTTTSSPAASTTCSGQTLGGEAKRRGVSFWSLEERQASSSCDALSSQYGVTTGDLQYLTGSDTCQVSKSICLPAACKLAQVASGDTCATLAGAAGNVTISQFLKWNTHIMGLCDSLTAGQYVCTSAPGLTGSYSLAPPPLGTGADAGNQQRGGAGGVVTPTTTVTTTANPISGGNAPSPTQDGLVTSCNNYAMASAGDGCYDFAAAHSIPTSKLYEWNPVLGSDGAACTTSFWASEYYCVGVRTPTTTTATISVTAPGPTQTGIIATCDKFAEAQSGDGCEVFAARNGITPADLYAWNGVLGVGGANCGTMLWGDEWYCVGVGAPGPTQTGIAANCDKFAEAVPGQGCYDFAAANGVTAAQLYAWNKVLGANGENCSTMLWGGEWYCVGVSG